MSRAEATQLYMAAGFPIVGGQPANRCGKPAKPRVTFVDINSDKRPEALFVDADPACYPPSGRYFAVLTKSGSQWRALLSGTGTVQAQATRTGGWLDLRVSDAGGDKLYRHDGRAYAATGDSSGPPAAPRAAQAAPAPAPPKPTGTSAATLSKADEAAAFKAAGFKQRGSTWRSGCDDPGTASYQPGRIEQTADLNGDGRPEALIVESGTYCYGHTGQGFSLVSQGEGGRWTLMTSATGIAEFLSTKGAGGWPDISVGGPGFCFPVLRWDGKSYQQQRWQYEGKACKPPR